MEVKGKVRHNWDGFADKYVNRFKATDLKDGKEALIQGLEKIGFPDARKRILGGIKDEERFLKAIQDKIIQLKRRQKK